MTNERYLEQSEEQIELELQTAIMANQLRCATRQSSLPAFADWDGETCFDCLDRLPKIRVLMGRVRCVPCQEIAEKRGHG